MLSLRGLAKNFAGRPLFRDVNLELPAGRIAAILGDSGSGKTTLLNLVAGLLQADAGTVHLDGERIDNLPDDSRTRLRGARMGFVFQAFHLLPHLRLRENVALPLAVNGRRDEARVDALLDRLGLADRATAFPRELSGGEMQRAAIARALVHRPALVLADEPTGNLDESNAGEVLRLFIEAVRGEHCALLLVTHSQRAAAVADEAWMLGSGGLVRR